jgi:cellulose biosynthesis protein BcsQ
MSSFVLFNNKGGVGKTTLAFNLAHMFARLGRVVVAVDCDPQCNLSSIMLSEQTLFDLWQESGDATTISRCLEPVRRGKGTVLAPTTIEVAPNLFLLPGDLALARFEQTLAEEWAKKMSADNERALDVTTAIDLLCWSALKETGANIVLLDVGPNLGALNRAALLACDAVLVPLAPDLFSLRGLENMGPTLREWRREWSVVRDQWMRGRDQESWPVHAIDPIGYVVQQHLARVDRPVKGYANWAQRIPSCYRENVLQEDLHGEIPGIADDPHCLATLRHFASLVPLAQAARKPLFDLRQADGIGGGQLKTVAEAKAQIESLAGKILEKLGC